jgi:cytochrome c peroxidase
MAAIVFGTARASAASHRVVVTIEPRFDGQAMAFDLLGHRAASGHLISVTRLDFLLSNVALHRTDGVWLGLTNWYAYLSLREGRKRFDLETVPRGDYDYVRFQIGVMPEVNHRDPAEYPAGHPLNPEVNGLHWGGMGGYVFLALEGHWKDIGQRHANEPRVTINPALDRGYSFHLANDPQLMTVELPLALHLSEDRELRLALHVDKLLAQPNRITLNENSASTHSRSNDALADQLRENAERAFFVEAVTSPQPMALQSEGTNHVDLAAAATPYRLTISSYFPRPALPLDNPITEEGVELGRRLFFDTRLSVNNSQSCASCHKPVAAFSDVQASSLGAQGQPGTRNTMPLFNLAWKSSFFWDGRAATLREQVLQPIQNPIEMHETLDHVVKKLKSGAGADSQVSARSNNNDVSQKVACPSNDYPTLFSRAFGSTEITSDRLARALEQFLLTQLSQDSKFDRFLRGQDRFTDQEQRGFRLFHTEYDPRRGQFGADCFHCHSPPLFQSRTFANNGLDREFADVGRARVTGRDSDRGKFAVPSLRNVAATAPYMHDGRFSTLEEVVEHYARGVKRSSTLDPNLAKHPNGGVPLTDSDKSALVSFLKALTDERFGERFQRHSPSFQTASIP